LEEERVGDAAKETTGWRVEHPVCSHSEQRDVSAIAVAGPKLQFELPPMQTQAQSQTKQVVHLSKERREPPHEGLGRRADPAEAEDVRP
jgi:hypothetical protein